MSRGVMMVAYGRNARTEAKLSIASFHEQHEEYPVLLVSDTPMEGIDFQYAPDDDPSFRARKLEMYDLSPFDETLYLDADTRVVGNVSVGFDILNDGWDMVIIPSNGQGADFLWHVLPDERQQTRDLLQGAELQLQGGVFWFRKGEAVSRFFAHWKAEWALHRGQDQAALLRALHLSPIKIWLLGRPFNGGAVIQHRFGRAASGPKTRPDMRRKSRDIEI